jgi:hypothetical protein
VVKPLRIDSQALGEQPLRRRPILLARLPRVGELAVADEALPAMAVVSELPDVVAAQTAKTSTSYFVDSSHSSELVDSPQSDMPRDGQGQIATARTSSGNSSGKKKHRKKTSSGVSPPSNKRSHKQAPQPTGLAYLYCKMHEQTAPFAGAIVALALVSAAGLMYWMILAPAESAFEYQDIYPEVVNGEIELPSVEIPPFVPRSSPLPIPEQVVSSNVNDSFAEQVTIPQASELNSGTETSGKEAELVKTPAKKFNFTNKNVVEIPPISESPGLVSVPTPLQDESVEAPKVPQQIESTKLVGPVMQPAMTLVYPATDHAVALDFSKVLAAGKSGLLGQPTRAAASHQPNVQIFAPTQR